jgi:peptidoglycan hydrolase CwlO-like protein
VDKLLRLHEEHSATLRENGVALQKLAAQSGEIADLRVEVERLKMDLERREREIADLQRENGELGRRLALREAEAARAAEKSADCPTGPAADVSDAVGSGPGTAAGRGTAPRPSAGAEERARES